jgi:2-amino-4-hydroxy-6-hydroxymethyldihydropteridine diphosphokinase
VGRAYVALGANLGTREATLRRAVAQLDGRDDTVVVALSQLRETEPVGLLDQPRFLNGVVVLDTALGPRELLAVLLEIERGLGRVRDGARNGPRQLDLDLLLYDGETIDEPELTVPHPRLHERRFVLEPLADIDPALAVPGRGTVAELLAALDDRASTLGA